MNEFNLHEAHETASRSTCNLLVPLPCTLRKGHVTDTTHIYRILHGKCARTVFTHELWCIRNRTSERSERVRFLIQKYYVCYIHTEIEHPC